MLYLVGSRYFGTHRPDSDIDYIGDDSEENRALCEKSGLKRIDSPKTRYAGHGNDVCLYPDVTKYVQARDKLAEVPGVRDMSTDERHLKLLEILDALV